jgi:fermentation-respiration switch protein FrsA (DUF1100 family)
MGAAIAIITAASNPAVGAAVADSSFSDIQSVVAHAFRRNKVPPRPFLALTSMYNRWRYGYSFGAVRPINVVARIAPRPLLIIHGSADAITPLAHAHDLYAAAREPKELWVVTGVEHCGAYFADREAYVRRVAAFLEQSLAEQGAS